MSRSNLDKPFFVDVGTSIVAIRCQSNRDVIDRINYVRLGKVYIEMANNMCDRMNAEVDKVVAEKDAENAKLRSLVKELSDKLHIGIYCGTVYDACGITDICGNAGACALVAKARHMIGGAK